MKKYHVKNPALDGSLCNRPVPKNMLMTLDALFLSGVKYNDICANCRNTYEFDDLLSARFAFSLGLISKCFRALVNASPTVH